MAETYRLSFRKARFESFMKQSFEISNFSNSRRNSHTRIVPTRILNTFISAINNVGVLPRFIIFVLDTEIMKFLDYSGYGVSTLYGNLLESLIKKVNDAVTKTKNLLPSKAVKDAYPQIYWTHAVSHVQFGPEENELRRKYNLCLVSIVKLYPNMRVIKLRNWNFFDTNLVQVNKTLSPIGNAAFWQALDNAMKFNVEKKEEYLARALIAQKKINDLSCQ